MSPEQSRRERERELRHIWNDNRDPVWCATDDYGSKYRGGYRLRRLPSADEQARRMR